MSIVNLVIENDPTWEGIPQMLKDILEVQFQENRRIIYSMSEKLVKNKDEVMEQVLSIPAGSNIIGETNFHEDDTLEKMTLLLYALFKKGIRVNVYCILGNDKYVDLRTAIDKYLALLESFGEQPGLSKKVWKDRLNVMFREVTQYHNVIWMMTEHHKIPIVY